MSKRNKGKARRMDKQMHTYGGPEVPSYKCRTPTASLPTTRKLDRPLEQEWEC